MNYLIAFVAGLFGVLASIRGIELIALESFRGGIVSLGIGVISLMIALNRIRRARKLAASSD